MCILFARKDSELGFELSGLNGESRRKSGSRETDNGAGEGCQLTTNVPETLLFIDTMLSLSLSQGIKQNTI